ncbi:MAG: DUF1573 domain-containing protein [Bacteroidota bacterium]
MVFSQAVINFHDSIYDFGTIKKENSIVDYTFIFFNSGKDSLILNDVKNSYSCITTEWNQRDIAPGKSDSVKLHFNPKGIRGSFYKTIHVISNASNNQVSLHLQGEVFPENTSYNFSGTFFQIGSLKFSTVKLNMDTILDTEIKYDSVLIVNAGTRPVSLTLNKNNDYINVSAYPDTLMPQMAGYIYISYDAGTKEIYGDFFDRITVLTDDSLIPKKSFSVHGFVKEDFSMLSGEEMNNAPVAVFDKEIFEMGDIQKDDKIPLEFQLENNGKSDLILRKIKPGCGCTVLTSDVNKVSPGETVKLQFVFDSAGKTGSQNKKIVVFLNDPSHPVFTLFINGNILP